MTTRQVLYELPYAQARQFRDLSMAKGGVRMFPRGHGLSPAEKLQEVVNDG